MRYRIRFKPDEFDQPIYVSSIKRWKNDVGVWTIGISMFSFWSCVKFEIAQKVVEELNEHNNSNTFVVEQF